jgi:hypothetical protein
VSSHLWSVLFSVTDGSVWYSSISEVFLPLLLVYFVTPHAHCNFWLSKTYFLTKSYRFLCRGTFESPSPNRYIQLHLETKRRFTGVICMRVVTFTTAPGDLWKSAKVQNHTVSMRTWIQVEEILSVSCDLHHGQQLLAFRAYRSRDAPPD